MPQPPRVGSRLFDESPFILEDARVVLDSEMCQGVVGAMTRCPNGDLLAAYMTRTDAIVDNAAFLLRSTDNGMTWRKEPDFRLDTRGDGSMHVAQGMTTLADGRLLMPVADVGSGRTSPEDHPRYMKLRARPWDLQMMVSGDDGHSWSGPEEVAPRRHLGPIVCPYGRIVALSADELLLPFFAPRGPLTVEDFATYIVSRGPGKPPDPEEGNDDHSWQPDPRLVTRSMVLHSSDGGRTWPRASIVAEHPWMSMAGAAHVQCADGSLVALMRTSADAGGSAFLWQARSRDGGHTWQDRRPSGIMGETPALHRLPSGRLVLAYRKTGRLWDDDRAGLGVSWSDDEGETWQGELTLVDPKGHEYRFSHETGNPGIVELADERILVLFYSYDSGLPFDCAQEADPGPWAEVAHFWKRYIACNVLRVR